jgi:hypothetical protein
MLDNVCKTPEPTVRSIPELGSCFNIMMPFTKRHLSLGDVYSSSSMLFQYSFLKLSLFYHKSAFIVTNKVKAGMASNAAPAS